MNILLGVHPAERHVTVSRVDRRHLFLCVCGEKTIEPSGRPAGRPVRCDACGSACKPFIVEALPEQHGIWIGSGECDPADKSSLLQANYKCIGYCTKEADAQIWEIEKISPQLMADVRAAVSKQYGGEPLVHEKIVLTKEQAKSLGMPYEGDDDEPPPTDEEAQQQDEEEE